MFSVSAHTLFVNSVANFIDIHIASYVFRLQSTVISLGMKPTCALALSVLDTFLNLIFRSVSLLHA